MRVPDVVWSHTTRRVLTLQDVGAIKITDYAAIEAAGINRGKVAKRLLDIYLKQVFEDGFFHADPHPGNLFVLPEPRAPGGWRLVFVDFGMTGTLPPDTFEGLRDALVSVGTRDAARLVGSFQQAAHPSSRSGPGAGGARMREGLRYHLGEIHPGHDADEQGRGGGLR